MQDLIVELRTSTLERQVLKLAVHLVARKKLAGAANQDQIPGEPICAGRRIQLIIRINYPWRKELSSICKLAN